MKIYFIIISLFYFEASLSQNIENEWKDFYCENWKIEIDSVKSNFLGKEIQYTLSFVNIEGNAKKINYYVYKKSDIDYTFKKNVEEYLFVQSCFFQAGKFNFKSFYFREFYFFLIPCHCSTKENIDCGKLAESIENYVEVN